MENTVDLELDQSTIAQLSFKDSVCRQIALAIVAGFLHDRIQWSDEITMPELGEGDRNCIGLTWRRLCKLGILKRMEGADDHRRSTKETREKRRGGICWKYRLVSEGLAKTFLKRNGWTPAKRNGWTPAKRGQPELALEVAP